jgi:hypothetical protein
MDAVPEREVTRRPPGVAVGRAERAHDDVARADRVTTEPGVDAGDPRERDLDHTELTQQLLDPGRDGIEVRVANLGGPVRIAREHMAAEGERARRVWLNSEE